MNDSLVFTKDKESYLEHTVIVIAVL